MRWLSLLLFLHGVARAEVSEQVPERAVDLVQRLYLYPDQVDPQAMLLAAGRGLADELDWLMVSERDGAMVLRHGAGAELGSVQVTGLSELPAALEATRSLVLGAGDAPGEVDLRLELVKGMMTALDPYSRVLSGERLEQFDVRIKGTMEGIGATVNLRDGALWVKALVPGGPAALGGVQVGDVLERIDGVSTVNMALSEAVRRLRGDSGTAVAVSVRRGEAQLTLVLTRASVVVPNVTQEVLPGPVGYVRIDHFSQVTLENLRHALDELRAQGGLERGLVMDLRGNTGGSMKQAAGVADLFVEHGVLLRTQGPDGGTVQNLQAQMEAHEGDVISVPLVLLVDERTASGSEILAGTLLELDRVALVGTRTFGKGVVQKIYPLDEGVRLKLTVARYLVANDRPIDVGIVPDLSVASVTFDGYGARYRGWHEGKAGVPFEALLPLVYVRADWAGEERDPGDVELEIARRAALRAVAPTREAAVAAVNEVVVSVNAEEEEALAVALGATDVDWSPAQAPGPEPTAKVTVQSLADPQRQDVFGVRVEVENLGDEPLFQAQVQLECDSFSAWDGLVVPVGWIGPGESAVGTVFVPIKPGIHLRSDPVRVILRADQRPPARLPPATLQAVTSERPRLAVDATLAGEGSVRTVSVRLRNLSEVQVDGLDVSFAHPGDLDLELLEAAAPPVTLPGGGEAVVSLSLRVGPEAPAVLPLTLQASGDRYGRLLSWPLPLPREGGELSLRAPEIRPVHLPVEVEVGEVDLHFTVRDEGALDHVVVYANGEKIAWAGAGAQEIVAHVPLKVGVNRLAVMAEDDQGVRGQESYRVLATGEGEGVAGGEADE
ncbi:MAG: PDZ domain-containing protein [Deltaproteobacteria bacterium]|nr:PDZ domain-containing protein [Deltaproteobacteria bacterium]